MHWTVSSIAGFLLTGQYRPVCSLSQSLPDCGPRRAFERAMDRAFEPDHCRKIHATWLIGYAVRSYILKENN